MTLRDPKWHNLMQVREHSVDTVHVSIGIRDIKAPIEWKRACA